MRYWASFVLVVFVLLMSPRAVPASEEAINGTVVPFFEALKTGDVKAVKMLLGGELEARMRPTLEDNKDYVESLKNRYEGSQVNILTSSEVDGELSVAVRLSFRDGGSELLQLVLRKATDGRWRIIGENVRP
jgi:hypothetical protein